VRKELSARAGYPLVLTLDRSGEILEMLGQPEWFQYLSQAPSSASLASVLMLPQPEGADPAYISRVVLKHGFGAG